MKKMTLSQLLEAYFVGNKKAQEELMKRCFAFVRGKIFANDIKCRHQKEELVTEIIVKILNKIDTFTPNQEKPDMGFWAWVSTICFNSYMDYFRNTKKSYKFLSVFDMHENNVMMNAIIINENWLNYTSNKEHLNKMMEMAKKLPEKQYKIIKLIYWFDYNMAEIAKCLNETENNVRVLHHRALKKLYEMLYKNNDKNSLLAA